MKKSILAFDDSLIISRLQQKELAELKPGSGRISHTSSPMEKFYLDPFADNLPIKIGLSLNLLGSKIVTTQVERGYLYQNLQDRLSMMSYPEALQAMACLNHHTPVYYQLALMLAMEELLQLTPPPAELWMRGIALEYARVFHHVHVVSQVLLCLDMDGLNDLARTAYSLMKPLAEILTRVHIKEAAFDTSPEAFTELLENLDNLIGELEALVSFENLARQFLRKKAVITLSLASSFGLTGIYLRANRSLHDLRSGYGDRPQLDISEGGDAWARFTLRIREMKSSLEWLKRTYLIGSADGMILKPLMESRNLQTGDAKFVCAFGEIAAPEGDTKISIFIDKNNMQAIFRLRSPAYFVAQALPHLLFQADLTDLPWVLHSLGISAEEIDL